MAEFTSVAVQTVAPGQNAILLETPVCGNNCSIVHREGSGLITLRGNTRQCRALYKVSFGGNIAVPTGQTVGPISFAIAVDGEALQSATVIETPAAVEQFANVYSSVFLSVPAGCCSSIGIQNTGTIPTLLQNLNVIVERVA